METAQSLESNFVESGRRAHIVWRLDGSHGGDPGHGVWIGPLSVLDGLDFAVWRSDSGLLHLERFAAGYRRENGISEITYRLPDPLGLRLKKRVWVPLDEPAVVTELLVENPTPAPIELPLFL